MRERQKQILWAVVEEYQRTGQPVSSQILIEEYNFDLSPATLRAEMLKLDKSGFLEQPHTSAGRRPTDKALRLFIDEFINSDAANEKKQERSSLDGINSESGFLMAQMAKFLADATHNLGISGLFNESADFHEAGFRWLAREPEFNDNLDSILESVDSLADDFDKFFNDIDQDIKIFVGRENPIRQLRDCSLMITGFEGAAGRGIFGILGPKRMDYGKNKLVLEEARKKVKSKK